jgi:serine/threonine-protein kinase mTOR
VAVKALMSILRDSSLSVHHGMVTQAVMFIFKSLGLRCVPFLEHILPNMLHVVRRYADVEPYFTFKHCELRCL